ncbi:galectin-12 isoform 2 [Lynx pardinus]|uniref:Galectin n=1 Tax=Lynx pardinus TaxID=191816 RepID=A0A485PAS8_LYNPA|nr:galectin-12 isoform 2 [Lynx pardinus]
MRAVSVWGWRVESSRSSSPPTHLVLVKPSLQPRTDRSLPLVQVVPYVTTIFGGLRAGKMVTLQGVVPLDARRFQVDFQCGCSVHPRPDIAIHFNPRFHTTNPLHEVPCSRALPKGLWPGQVIVLRGLVLPEPKESQLGLRERSFKGSG